MAARSGSKSRAAERVPRPRSAWGEISAKEPGKPVVFSRRANLGSERAKACKLPCAPVPALHESDENLTTERDQKHVRCRVLR